MKYSFFVILIFIFSSVLGQNLEKRKEATALVEKGIQLNDNSEQEIGYYKKAIELDPTYYAPYYNLGNIFFFKKDYKTAIEYYEKACQLSKKDKDCFYNLALAYYMSFQYPQAIQNLQINLKIDPKDYEALYLLCKIYSTTQSKTSLNFARLSLQQILKESHNSLLKEKASKLLEKVEKDLGLRK